jgi:hypothetical protein
MDQQNVYEKRRSEMRAEFLRRLGVTELPKHVQVDTDVIVDLVDLHGDAALDELVQCTREAMQRT